MIKKILTAAFLMTPSVTLAQTAVVRSGDHAEFTRLTVAMPSGTDWQIDQNARRVSLRFDGALRTLDISNVFSRISRDRIADISTVPGPGMEILLGCDCVAKALTASGNLLVIDIASGIPPVIPPVAQADAGWRPALPDLFSQGGLSFGQPPAQTPRSPAPWPEQVQTDPLGIDRPAVAANGSFARDAVNAPPSGIRTPSTSGAELTRELETRLLAAIGQAATEGLLDADPASVRDLPDDIRHLSAPADSLHGPDPGLAAKPSTLEADEAEDPRIYLLSRDGCSTHLDPFVATSATESFDRRLGHLRAALTGEFDRDHPEAYLDLAQFYLMNGFGAEALRLMDSVPQNPEVHDEIQSIARIMEYGHDRPDGSFAGKMDCETEAALWAALTGPAIAPGTTYDGAAIKRSVMTLPPVLKSYLGSLLAERFTIAQEKDFAKDLLRLVDRDIEEPTPRRDLAEALIQTEETGRPDKAAFDALISKNDEISPEALLHYTNELLRDGAPVDAETIGLIESYRSQFRDAPIATRLLKAEIGAQASTGNFATAFALLAEGRDELDAEARSTLADNVTAGLATAAPDTVFARLYFQHQELIALSDRPETQNTVAERLLMLGFLDQAETVARSGAEGKAGRDRRILRARIALSKNRPRQAEAELFGMNGEDIDRLRAEARLMSAEFDAAKELFSAAGDTASAENAAWLARDWRTLRESEAAPASRLAEVVSAQQEAPVDLPEVGPPTLEASRDALTQAGETRAALQDLLSTMQVDTALDQ